MIQNVNTVFTAFIIVMCLVFAYFAAFTDLFEEKLAGQFRYVFVGIMLVYAVFRTYRLVKTIRQQNQKNQE